MKSVLFLCTACRWLQERIERLLALGENRLGPRDWRDAVTRIGGTCEGATGG